MLDWIGDNAGALNVFINLGMLGIWIVYLQVFLLGYRRNTMPKIVISRNGSNSFNSWCLVSNMSSKAIFIESIIASLETENGRRDLPVTDLTDLGDDGPSNPLHRTYQGTLQPGEYTNIGSFDELLRRGLNQAGEDERILDDLDTAVTARIQVFADYASEDLLIGAERSFDASYEDGRWSLRARRVETKQIRSRRERQEIQNRLRERV